MKYILVFLMILIGAGCSTKAELIRPDDVAMIRGSYTKVGTITSWITGGTDVCQITALEVAPELLSDYAVILDEDGCSIIPKEIYLYEE